MYYSIPSDIIPHGLLSNEKYSRYQIDFITMKNATICLSLIGCVQIYPFWGPSESLLQDRLLQKLWVLKTGKEWGWRNDFAWVKPPRWRLAQSQKYADRLSDSLQPRLGLSGRLFVLHRRWKKEEWPCSWNQILLKARILTMGARFQRQKSSRAAYIQWKIQKPLKYLIWLRTSEKKR